jgi:hypothetical protein
MKTASIAEVLGGRKVLGKDIKNPDDLAELVRKGLPASAVTALAERLDVGSIALSQKLGIPQRTAAKPAVSPHSR